jgi:hypothetical protein
MQPFLALANQMPSLLPAYGIAGFDQTVNIASYASSCRLG